jgi:LPXTG-motif cell wall-anchored protein
MEINIFTTKNISLHTLAQGYSCDAYGVDAYSTCTTATEQPGQDTGGGFLSDTGYNILLPIALGLALIVASVILLFKRQKRRRSNKV